MYMHSHSVTAPVCRVTQDQSRPQPDSQQASRHVRVEISTDKLRELVNMGALCAGDMHCLDCESKHCVWRICLRACLKQFVGRPATG